MKAASPTRWAKAQAAERSFWAPSTYRSEIFSATLAGLAESAAWMQGHLPRPLPEGDRVELGIGPMGLACVHLLPCAPATALVGVDPLERTPATEWPLTDPQMRVLKAFQNSYEHVVARAEETGLEGGRFGAAVLHNMLDHVQDPAAVLAEAHRLLAPGGFLLLACDTISLANRLRLRLYAQRRLADSLFVRAHPFHFRVGELLRLLSDAGFRTLVTNRRRPALLYETVGHAHRLLVLAERPDFA